jgi:hypothetical protein
MKKSFLLKVSLELLFALLILISCRKSISSNNNLIGQWQWVYSTGGIAVQTVKPIGNIVAIAFNKDSTYIYTENGIIQSNDKYFITIDNIYGKVLHLANFNGSKLWLSSNGEIFTIKNDQLEWVDYMISDGYSHFFQRIK